MRTHNLLHVFGGKRRGLDLQNARVVRARFILDSKANRYCELLIWLVLYYLMRARIVVARPLFSFFMFGSIFRQLKYKTR